MEYIPKFFDCLKKMLNPKLAIVFFGETSSGKTTLINALVSTILSSDQSLLPTNAKENTIYFKII